MHPTARSGALSSARLSRIEGPPRRVMPGVNPPVSGVVITREFTPPLGGGLTSHRTGRAISLLFIADSALFIVPCAPVNDAPC